ncbi:MAG: 3-phenylpropionate/cinnamic acid dioxygenase subunit beta [Proteobacteria bacterium]|nr:3-phenylpropionate/cinnamic acid dioxygenase subunit beta [Pseudomonadota bacterium]
MDGAPDSAVLAQIVLHHRVEQFYIAEAELLDTRRFREWLALLDADIRYWMPVACNREMGRWDGEYTKEGTDLNWFDEGKFELEQRVEQIMTGLHWAEEPVSRTSHMVANLRVAEADDGLIDAHCRFFIYRNRNETETDFFVGKRRDRLRPEGDSFKIAAREIFLDQSVLQAKNLTLFF